VKPCYILVVNYKRWEEALECIRSVFVSDYPDFKVILTDNCSDNGSLEKIRQDLQDRPVEVSGISRPLNTLLVPRQEFAALPPSKLPDLTLVQNDSNAGFAAGNNIALRVVMEEDAFIWLLNPDMTVAPDTLAAMIRCAQSGEHTVVGSVHRSFYDHEKVILYGGARVNYWLGNTSFIKKPEDIGRTGYISGGSLLADASTFRAVGILPEDYFLYWEETDWCYQARGKGFPIVVCPEATTYDKRSTTIGNGFWADYFYTRNGLLFLKKFKRAYVPSAFLMTFVRVAKKLALGQGGRAKGVMLGAIDFLTGRRYEKKRI
jgi:GT2 family glycosyltransferase